MLLVEDSSLVVNALRLLLEQHGYEVTTADSIEAARNAAAHSRPDFALLDLTLPDGDGLDLASEWSRAPAVAVLALTGHADEATRARCMEAGCRAVLVKPVLSADLLTALAAAQR
ncbi:MAG TPA: response regulator [Gemmatimonadaceae bacterium]